MKAVPARWRQQRPDQIRAELRRLARAREMVRVVLPSGCSFVGIPTLRGRYVTLRGIHGDVKATVRVRKIDAVQPCRFVRSPLGG